MTGSTMTDGQAKLAQRLRTLLASEPSTREVSMFGGLAFMVNNKIVVSAQKGGDLLVRVAPECDAELLARPGASRAEMGVGRSMGVGWIAVVSGSLVGDDQLSLWLDSAQREAAT